jgi:hypothetical protein
MPINANELIEQRIGEVVNRVNTKITDILTKEFDLENTSVTIPWDVLLSCKEWTLLMNRGILESILEDIRLEWFKEGWMSREINVDEGYAHRKIVLTPDLLNSRVRT